MANVDEASALHTVDAAQLKILIAEARASARRRSHLLLHAGHGDQVQRLVIAAEPGTYIRPHHHSEQWEMLILLRGMLDVLIFDAQGTVRERRRLDASAPVVQITMGEWHGCIAAESGTVVMEFKPGPFRPNEFADWAPPEQDAEAKGCLDWLSRAKPNERWQGARV
jgi:cupin fold WbuC family metalloprotein